MSVGLYSAGKISVTISSFVGSLVGLFQDFATVKIFSFVQYPVGTMATDMLSHVNCEAL
jgi:ABC-type enterobactin transport system permease subunit